MTVRAAPGYYHELVDGSAPPFRPRIETVIDLPFPPSTNRLWRVGKSNARNNRPVYRALEYKRWLLQADITVMANGSFRTRIPIPGRFTATILLSREAGRGDVDNRAKAILDWAQSRELIRDDDLCEEVVVRWVEADKAPAGARLILKPIE